MKSIVYVINEIATAGIGDNSHINHKIKVHFDLDWTNIDFVIL